MNGQAQVIKSKAKSAQEDTYVTQDICDMLSHKASSSDIQYLESPVDPTWFKKKDDAITFMRDLEAETGVRHALISRYGGYTVVPFYLEDAEGINIEEYDLLYTANDEIYHINRFIRKSEYEWVAEAEREGDNQSLEITQENAADFRHNSWTDKDLKELHKKQMEETRQRNNSERKVRLEQSFEEFKECIQEVLLGILPITLVIGSCIGIVFLLNFTRDSMNPQTQQTQQAQEVQEAQEVKQAAAGTTTFNCKITGKSHENKTKKTEDGGLAYIEYYYITVTDDQSTYPVQFNCTKEFYESIKMGDTISITMTTKEIDMYNTKHIFMVGDQELTNYYVVKD